MQIGKNVCLERLKEGKVAFGLSVRSVSSVAIARAAATSGYHYLFIDMEHCSLSLESVGEICVAALDAGVTPTVRVPEGEFNLATRILDAGAQGVVIPHVETAAQAREAVRRCKFPPLGSRSYAGSAVQLGWQKMSPQQVGDKLNEELLLTVTIESLQGLENVEEIAAVKGVDAIAVGSNDLTFDMGIPGEFAHARLDDAYGRIVAAGNRNGVAVRLGGVYDAASLQRTIGMGARMVTVTSDVSLLVDGMRARLADVTANCDPALI